MKNLFFSLIAIVSLSLNLNAKNINSEYFSKPIFKLLEQKNPELFNELKFSNLQIKNVDGKNVYYATLKNGYFIDDSEKMIYSEFDKIKNKLIVYDFTSNYKTYMNLIVDRNNKYSAVDDKNIVTQDIFDNNTANNSGVTFKRGCRDHAGFALCYAGVLISSLAIAASDGPLPFMDAAAISYAVVGTASCIRSNC